MDMEYGDPNAGLRRGLLMFDTPGDTLATIETTLERVGAQAQVAINNAGQVAFSLDAPVTIQYFTPPLPGGGVPSSTLTVPAGVHRATPTPFGTPFSFTTIATPADGYSAFGKVALNDSGTVVFEANHNSNTGVFFGANAATDTIAITGEDVTVGGRSQFFSIVRLGGLNDANQLAIQTSDFRTTDQQIWRVQLPLA
jgi:VCBS repeat-containing protein